MDSGISDYNPTVDGISNPWNDSCRVEEQGTEQEVTSMVVSGSRKGWDRWHIIPELAVYYHLYTIDYMGADGN